MHRVFGRPKPPPPRAPAVSIEVEHEGVRHRVAVKRVATARRFTLRVRAARRDVVLTMPPHSSAKAAGVFAQRNAEWIASRLQSLAPAIAFTPGTDIPYQGEVHRLVHRPGLRRHVTVEADGGGGPALCVSGPAGQFETIVAGFLRREAAAHLGRAVERLARTVDRPVGAVRIRDTRSRWGSCSQAGTLNFSWRLILAPPFVLEYLAAHEVAHLVHMNHSDAFWQVTRALAPQTDEAEAWLKAHGAGLHRYGA